MRAIRTLLVIMLVLVMAAFGYTEINKRLSGKDEGPAVSCPEDMLYVSVKDPESVLLEGVKATDPQDGDISDKVIVGGVSKLIENNTAKVTYYVFDSDDNMSSCSRMITYTDYQRPTLLINKPLHYATGETADLISRLGATDIIDGDISQSVRISTLVATNHSQIYAVTAQITNSMGDTSSVRLPVLYRESVADRPEITLKEQLIYLDKGADFDPMDYLAGVTVRDTALDSSATFIENEVNTAEDGTYWVWYSYTNGDHEGISILTVVVR